jgi:hypothetical protein
VGVNDRREVDLSGFHKRGQSRNHAVISGSVLPPWKEWEAVSLLLGVCGVNNDSVFGFLVDNKVCIVVTLPPSCNLSDRILRTWNIGQRLESYTLELT